MKSGDVVVHTTESLNFLLCGAAPLIISKRNNHKQIQVKSKPQNTIDMSAFPPEITNYRKNKRSKSAIRSHRPNDQSILAKAKNVNENQQNSKNFQKLQNEKQQMDRISVELQTYSDNQKRKTFQIHQDWEQRYVQPFLHNLQSQLHGDRYDQFIKDRTISTIQASSISDKIQQSRAQSQIEQSRTQSRLQTSRDSSKLKFSNRPKTSIERRRRINNIEDKTLTKTEDFVQDLSQTKIASSSQNYDENSTIRYSCKSRIRRSQLANRPPFTNYVGVNSNTGVVGYSSLHDVDAEASLSIPYIRVNTSRCDDRIHKFKKHEEQEIALTKVILQDQMPQEEMKKPIKERSALDISEMKFLSETRLYFPGKSMKGRRPFKEILQSTVDKQLDQF